MNTILFGEVQRAKDMLKNSDLIRQFPLTHGILMLYQYISILNIVNQTVIHVLLIYWNYTFWWEFTEATCVYFQYIRYFVLISYGILTSIAQVSLLTFFKKPELTFIFQFLIYYSFPIVLILALPNINIWKLSVKKPSTILRYKVVLQNCHENG